MPSKRLWDWPEIAAGLECFLSDGLLAVPLTADLPAIEAPRRGAIAASRSARTDFSGARNGSDRAPELRPDPDPDRLSAPVPICQSGLGSHFGSRPRPPTYHEKKIRWWAVVVGCRSTGRAEASGTGADCWRCGVQGTGDRGGTGRATRGAREERKTEAEGDEMGSGYVLRLHGRGDREHGGRAPKVPAGSQSRPGAAPLCRPTRRGADRPGDDGDGCWPDRHLRPCRDLCRSGPPRAPGAGSI